MHLIIYEHKCEHNNEPEYGKYYLLALYAITTTKHLFFLSKLIIRFGKCIHLDRTVNVHDIQFIDHSHAKGVHPSGSPIQC